MRELRVVMLIFTPFFNHPTQAHEFTSKLDSLLQTIKNYLVEDNAPFAESNPTKDFQLFVDIYQRNQTDFAPQLNFRNLIKTDIDYITAHKTSIEKGLVE